MTGSDFLHFFTLVVGENTLTKKTLPAVAACSGQPLPTCVNMVPVAVAVAVATAVPVAVVVAVHVPVAVTVAVNVDVDVVLAVACVSF